MRDHRLVCDGRPLGYREREERPWYCTCGAWRSYGYDAPVRREFAAHKRDALSSDEL